EIVDRAVVMTEELGEAAPQRVVFHIGMSEMPLAEDAAVFVSGSGQAVSERFFSRIEPALAPRRIDCSHRPVADGVTAGHQPRAGGRADRVNVKAFELDAFGGELVDVRRPYFAAVEADVVKTEIVGEQDDDVRLVL